MEYSSLRLGEIFALHGWLEQQTADFFAEKWPRLLNEPQPRALGYYLQEAAILDEQQVEALLKEQWQTGVRLGALAVLRGWLKQDTLDFFLKNLAPAELSESPFTPKPKVNVHKTTNSDQPHKTTNPDVEWSQLKAKDLDDLKWLG
jgi:hypothetical protein